MCGNTLVRYDVCLEVTYMKRSQADEHKVTEAQNREKKSPLKNPSKAYAGTELWPKRGHLGPLIRCKSE